MRNWLRSGGILCLLAALLLLLPVWAGAESLPVEIRTPEELQKMAEDPTGSYILMNDVDMEGISWKALDFSGSFDGNGYAILNLTLSEPGRKRPISCDGNLKGYETSYVGLFGTLTDATVRNLKLIGLRAVIQRDDPCFVGGIAGYIDDSTVTGCTVTGVLELRAHDRMFGIGGMAGYGEGSFEDCTVDVTMICTDTGEKTRDEQFMGGILATGFANIRNCTVRIDGYCSEYGYCHNGGLIGMVLRYPLGKGSCTLSGNSVTGKITFFECNTDRRAYCEALVGEYLCSDYVEENNTVEFLRDERLEYDRELRPEQCENPVYTEEVVPGGCDTYGFTRHTCISCGYTYCDRYTSCVHTPGEWRVVKAPTVEEEGESIAHCPCGREFRRTEERLEAAPTTLPPTEAPRQTEPAVLTEPPAPEAVPEGQLGLEFWLWVEGVLFAALIVLLWLRFRR